MGRMKNMMVWANPYKAFNAEESVLVKLQIDNSRELGWDDEDIWLFTNFEYEYDGIEAKILPDEACCHYKSNSTKIPSLLEIFKKGYIEEGGRYWIHDFDCYQLVPIKEDEVFFDGIDLSLCDYGRRRDKWSGGSLFFTKSAEDIFKEQYKIMDEHKCVDEPALKKLLRSKPKMRSRVRKLNSAYHFLPFNVKHNYAECTKPLRIAHFHPYKYEKRAAMRDSKGKESKNLFEFYCGGNKADLQLIPDRLIRLFNKHGIK